MPTGTALQLPKTTVANRVVVVKRAIARWWGVARRICLVCARSLRTRIAVNRNDAKWTGPAPSWRADARYVLTRTVELLRDAKRGGVARWVTQRAARCATSAPTQTASSRRCAGSKDVAWRQSSNVSCVRRRRASSRRDAKNPGCARSSGAVSVGARASRERMKTVGKARIAFGLASAARTWAYACDVERRQRCTLAGATSGWRAADRTYSSLLRARFAFIPPGPGWRAATLRTRNPPKFLDCNLGPRRAHGSGMSNVHVRPAPDVVPERPHLRKRYVRHEA